MTDLMCELHGVTGAAKNQVKEIVCDQPAYRVGTPPCNHTQPLCYAHYGLVPLMKSMTCEKCGNEWPIETIGWTPPPGDDDDAET